MRKLTKIITIACALIIQACAPSSREEVEIVIRDAEMAVAQGDMISAGSIAEEITGNKNLSGLTADQLGRLSMVYMQIADSMDYDDNLSRAADFYRQAFSADSASADSFYRNIDQEKFSQARMLATFVSSIDNAGKIDLFADTIAEDTIIHPEK